MLRTVNNMIVANNSNIKDFYAVTSRRHERVNH